MEGIFDGRAVDGCFYCDLLYPEEHVDDCPRCGRRMRYQPAVMMSQPELEALITGHVQAYTAATSDQRQPNPERRAERLTEQNRAVASSARHDEGAGCWPAAEEQRRDVPQIHALATEGKSPGALVALLEAIHRFMPASLAILQTYEAEYGGPNLDTLRQAWASTQAQ